jgi:hypothetical protein
VFKNTYRDSVESMRIAAEAEHLPGVTRVGVVMATPANLAVLADAGLLAEQSSTGGRKVSPMQIAISQSSRMTCASTWFHLHEPGAVPASSANLRSG